MAITDWNPAVAEEIGEMVKAGVTSFKLYLAYDNLRVTDAELYEILKRVGQAHGIIGTHCENGDLVNEKVAELRAAGKLGPRYHALSRPDYVEAEAIARYCYIAGAAGVPVHIVHLSTRAGLEEARRARARGQKVYLETCPQYLVLDGSRYDAPASRGRNTSARRRSEASMTRRRCGRRSETARSTRSPPTIAATTTRARRIWARTISAKSPTACPASSTGPRRSIRRGSPPGG